jgi:hypothetical protein
MFESAGERHRQAGRAVFRVSEIRIGHLSKATFGSWYCLRRSSRLGPKYSSGIGGEPTVVSRIDDRLYFERNLQRLGEASVMSWKGAGAE